MKEFPCLTKVILNLGEQNLFLVKSKLNTAKQYFRDFFAQTILSKFFGCEIIYENMTF